MLHFGVELALCIVPILFVGILNAKSTVQQRSSGENAFNVVAGDSTTITFNINQAASEDFESHQDVSVSLVIDTSSGMPLVLPGTLAGANPGTFLGLQSLFGGSKQENRQRAFAGIAMTPMQDDSPLVLAKPVPGHEDEYSIQLIEFAILREIQGLGAITNWSCGISQGKSGLVKSGADPGSPLSVHNRRVVSSCDMLKNFPSNWFAATLATVKRENALDWIIPIDAKIYCAMIQADAKNVAGRMVAIDAPGIFHAQIKIFPFAKYPEFLPAGFPVPDIPLSRMLTRNYRVTLEYCFEKRARGKKTARGNRKFAEYKKWIDALYANIKGRYGD